MISGIIFFPPSTDSTGVTVEVLKLNEGTDDDALKLSFVNFEVLKTSNVIHT